MYNAENIKYIKYNSVITYRGVDANGKDFFAYIVCDLKGAKKMKEDYKTRARVVDISVYGEVIYKDNISEPDAKAKKFLEEYLDKNNVY